jgi:hypothetical protein
MFQAITHGYNDTNPKEDDEFLQRKLIKAFTSDNNGTLPCHMSLLERQTIKSQIGEINSKSLFQSCLSICTISNAHENHVSIYNEIDIMYIIVTRYLYGCIYVCRYYLLSLHHVVAYVPLEMRKDILRYGDYLSQERGKEISIQLLCS